MTTNPDRTSGPYTAGFASFTASVRHGDFDDFDDENDDIDEIGWHGIVDMNLSLNGENIEATLTIKLVRDMIDALTRAAAIAEEMASEMDGENGETLSEELGNAG